MISTLNTPLRNDRVIDPLLQLFKPLFRIFLLRKLDRTTSTATYLPHWPPPPSSGFLPVQIKSLHLFNISSEGFKASENGQLDNIDTHLRLNPAELESLCQHLRTILYNYSLSTFTTGSIGRRKQFCHAVTTRIPRTWGPGWVTKYCCGPGSS